LPRRGYASTARCGAEVDIISVWTYNMDMKTVAAAKFKEQCLSILDHLDREGIVITKHGKPVARVLPMARASAEMIGALRGRIRVKGNIESTGQKWTASG
jgi:prevent-host-death family protein